MKKVLRNYQKRMLLYCLKTRHPALFVQMRLGKTIVTIRSLNLRRTKRNLIVAPYSALYGWKLELLGENQDINSIVELYGKRDERINLLQEMYKNGKGKWFLLNKEGHLLIPEIASYYFDAIIIDESTFIKSPYSTKKGCKATRFYCENFRDTIYRYILTGTPAPEGELDYFCQLKFLDKTIWDTDNYWEFKYRWFGTINFIDYLSPEGSRYLSSTLAKNCFFLSRHDVKLGGEKIYEKRIVQLTPKVRKIYNKIEKEFVLEYLGSKQDTIFATTKYIWLRRLCGGFADLEFISYSKLKELEEILLTELKREQVIIIAKHVNEVKKITKYLGKKFRIGMIYGGIDKRKRPEIYQSFQDHKLDLIVAQGETIKHGVNLSAADTIIFYTTPDGGETREQLEDRIVNTATNDSSLIIDLICEDTIEEDVIKNLNRKKSRQEMMKDIVQRLQRKHNLYGTKIK